MGDGTDSLDNLTLGTSSDLTVVDVESGKATMLSRATGFATPENAAEEKTRIRPVIGGFCGQIIVR